MIIFAVEGAAGAASAAILHDDRLLAESYADVGLTHSETLMPLCDEVFRRAALTPDDMDCFAVTAGPGSFTGLRIAMGTVKGLAMAAAKPCASISTLEALAYQAAPSARRLVSVLDARRGRVYHAAFDVSGGVRRMFDDTVVEIESLAEMHAGQPISLIGDGAALCYTILRNRMDCELFPAGNRMPRAWGVALATQAMGNADWVSAASLTPSYIQIPQAERTRSERENQL